jgi:tetratricopeptide (TPR) repeat protein
MFQDLNSKKKKISLRLVLTILVHFVVSCSHAPSTENNNVAAANNALKEVFKIGYPSKAPVVTMLAKQDYAALEAYYGDLEKQYKENYLYETYLFMSYEIIDPSLSALLPNLDDWVEQKGTYIAYCVRGFYYLQAGNKARGEDYIQNTPRNKILEMRNYHQKAIKDFENSLELNPNNVFANVGLIIIYTTDGDESKTKSAYEAAIKRDKRTYFARLMYLRSLTPRWGGAYDQMQTVINQSLPYANLNPRIWSLRGMIDYDKAYDYYLNDNYNLAIVYMGEALKYGIRTDWLKRRAECYGRTGQYQLELKDLEEVLYYNPRDYGTRYEIQRLKNS